LRIIDPFDFDCSLPLRIVASSWRTFFHFLKGLSGFHRMCAVSHAPQFIVGKEHALCAKDPTWVNLRPNRAQILVSDLKYLALYFNLQFDAHEPARLQQFAF